MSSTLLESRDMTDLEQLTEDKLFPPPGRRISPEIKQELPSPDADAEFRIYLEQKERAMKAKCVALEALGHHPLANPSKFSRRDKAKVLDLMTIWFNKTDEELTAEFNDVINDKVLNETSPYENYGIANNAITFADPPVRNVPVDLAGNPVDVYGKPITDSTTIPFGIL
jgi:hypothetical protein